MHGWSRFEVKNRVTTAPGATPMQCSNEAEGPALEFSDHRRGPMSVRPNQGLGERLNRETATLLPERLCSHPGSQIGSKLHS